MAEDQEDKLWETETPPEKPPEQTPPAVPSILEYMKGKGYDVSRHQSDDEVLADLEEGYAQVQQYTPVLSEYLKERQDYQRWKTERQTQKPAPEANPEQKAEPTQKPWKAPEVSEMAKRFQSTGEYKQHPSGYFVANDPRMQWAADEINQALQWRQQQADRFWSDPLSVLREAGLEQELQKVKEGLPDLKSLREEIKQEIFAELSRTSTVSQVERVLHQDQALLFRTNEKGEVVYNALGEPVKTEIGERYLQATRYAEEKYGITDPVKKHEFAYEFLTPELVEARTKIEQQKQKTPAQKRQEKQETFLEKATRDGKADRLLPGDATIQSAAVREANAVVTDDSLWAQAIKDAEASLV